MRRLAATEVVLLAAEIAENVKIKKYQIQLNNFAGFFIYERILSTLLMIFMKSLRFYGKIVQNKEERKHMKRSMLVVREEHIDKKLP